jgi:hypothetical protein
MARSTYETSEVPERMRSGMPYLGLHFGWRAETWAHADFDSSYAMCSGTGRPVGLASHRRSDLKLTHYQGIGLAGERVWFDRHPTSH